MILHVADNNALSLSVQSMATLSLSACEVIHIGADKYEGSYEWTPNEETQTIPINGLQAKSDIVINPIPSNYGLITWNGSNITVS